MRDVFLHIDTYSEPTPDAAIAQAVMFSGAIGARLGGLATHIGISAPRNWLAEQFLNVQHLAEVEEAKSLAAARRSLEVMAEKAAEAGVSYEGLIHRAPLHGIGANVASHARTRDMCLIAIGGHGNSQSGVAEEIIFGSGRPVLVFHPERAPLPSGPIKRVVIAWDASRCAARAASDAIPILRCAQDVRILTVLGEKDAARTGIASDLVRHLKVHDIEARVDEVDGRGKSIGASLRDYCGQQEPDLLVMGAYGSSRLKEFLLGGATQHILDEAPIAAFLSH